MKRVLVHIDRLVLKGFRHEDRHAIALGLQEELGRVFADREAVSHSRALGYFSQPEVPGLRIAHGAVPQSIGVQVAQSIFKGFKK